MEKSLKPERRLIMNREVKKLWSVKANKIGWRAPVNFWFDDYKKAKAFYQSFDGADKPVYHMFGKINGERIVENAIEDGVFNYGN